MVDVSTEIVIDAPVAKVAGFAGDPSNAPRWYENIKSVEWETEPVVRKGAQMAFVAHFLGKVLVYTYEIVDFVPQERLVMRTSQGPFPMETKYVWQALGQGQTRMILRNTGQPTGFSLLFSPLMALAMRLANRKDLRRLKKIMENG